MGLVLRRHINRPKINVYDREGRLLVIKVSKVGPNGNVELWFDGPDFIIHREEHDLANNPAPAA